MIYSDKRVETILDATLLRFATTVVALTVSTSTVMGVLWVLNAQWTPKLIVVFCLGLFMIFFSIVFANIDLSPTRSLQQRLNRFPTDLASGLLILFSLGAGISVAAILNKSLTNRLLVASDGPGHLAILLGLGEDQASGIYPYLLLSDGSRAVSLSPYPTGAHFLSVVVAMALGINSSIAYEMVVSTFEYAIFPLAIVCLFRCASGGELSLPRFFIALLAGVSYRPIAEFFQGPTVVGVSLAIAAASIAPRMEAQLMRVFFLTFVGLSLLSIHPSALLLFILITAKLQRRSIYKVYPLLLTIAGIGYWLTRANFRSHGYFTTWISSNESDYSASQYSIGSFLWKAIQNGVTFGLGMGRSDFLPVTVTIIIILPVVRYLKPSDLVDCCFVLLLLASSTLTGFRDFGTAAGLLTYPWYGTPHRFVIVWTVVAVVITAQSRQLPNLRQHVRH